MCSLVDDDAKEAEHGQRAGRRPSMEASSSCCSGVNEAGIVVVLFWRVLVLRLQLLEEAVALRLVDAKRI